MHPSLTVYNNSVFDFIDTNFEIEALDKNCQFTEGPVWNQDGFYLFSDITANVIYKLIPGREKEIYLANSGTDHPLDPDLKPDQAGSNGLAFDKKGNLIICQHGSHAVAKYDGVLHAFIESYSELPFNSPNDLVVHSDERIYFTDPPYGLKDGKLNPAKFQPLAGVYCWQNGMLTLICDRYQYPNGVCLSPDESLLYICSNKPFEQFISVYETKSNQFLKIVAEENSDGIECDRVGNIYLCNKDGLIILDGEGHRLALIALPTIPANLCWGGNELNDLFITARQNVFLIRNLRK